MIITIRFRAYLRYFRLLTGGRLDEELLPSFADDQKDQKATSFSRYKNFRAADLWAPTHPSWYTIFLFRMPRVRDWYIPFIVLPGLIDHPGQKWVKKKWICWFYTSILRFYENLDDFTKFGRFYQIWSILPNLVDFIKNPADFFRNLTRNLRNFLSVRPQFPEITSVRPYISRNSPK